MINIRDSEKKLVAILDLYTESAVIESINGEYTAQFAAIIDEDGKAEYIQHGNLVEIEGQYFNIVQHRRKRGTDGSLIVLVTCQQVAYDLLWTPFEEFVQSGTPAELLALLLPGTGFTIGTVEPTDIISVEFREMATARAILLEIAAQAGGELLFDKYQVSLLNQRGQLRGNQFRLGKNLLGIVKDSNMQTGSAVVSYEIDIVELNSLPQFAGLEYFELGDTIRIIDEELGIDELQRIIRYEYDPQRRIKSKVTIAADLPNIANQIVNLQRSTVAKDKFYYGNRIGPEIGFESVRSDKKARSVFNADEFRMQRGDGSGSSWTDAVYFDPTDGEYKFTGKVIASSFQGGSIQIGTAFSVNSSGHMVAVGAEFSGDISASIISGGQINGTTITGSMIRTNGTYPRAEMSSTENVLAVYYDADTFIKMQPLAGTLPQILFERYGVQSRIYSEFNGFMDDFLIRSNSRLHLVTNGGDIYADPGVGYHFRVTGWDKIIAGSQTLADALTSLSNSISTISGQIANHESRISALEAL